MLDWIESLSIATWLRESPSIWANPTVLTLHTTGMGVLVGASWVLDLRLLGVSRNTPLSAFRWVFTAVAFGLIVNLTTGILLFAKNANMWGTAFPFLIKMLLVVGSAATLIPLRRYVLSQPPDARDVNSRARLIAVASLLLWTSAITAGRLLAYLVA